MALPDCSAALAGRARGRDLSHDSRFNRTEFALHYYLRVRGAAVLASIHHSPLLSVLFAVGGSDHYLDRARRHHIINGPADDNLNS